jgi:anti-anti-sigma regulatory factor
MNITEQTAALTFTRGLQDKPLRISGDLTESNASEFERQMQAINDEQRGAVTLDMSELDIEDGPALVTTINALRALRARSRRLVLRGAPQMLGHNLYRTGMLDGSAAIELVDMRLDEANGA